MKKSFLVIIAFLSLMGACATQNKNSQGKNSQAHLELATVWVQNSGEWQALSYQAFNLAKWRLDQALKRVPAKKAAVVLDIDETVLDNSPFQAQGIIDGTGYPVGWEEWVSLGKARALPGAKDFLQYAQKKGVTIYYISNRKVIGYDATLRNLKEENLPVAEKNLLLRQKDKSKEPRRLQASKDKTIVMLIGDNLGDFHAVFEDKSNEERNKSVANFKSEWGDKFIVLPNPMYGDWEGAVYDNDFSLSDEQKQDRRLKSLRAIK